jgi:hypothetical protein
MLHRQSEFPHADLAQRRATFWRIFSPTPKRPQLDFGLPDRNT